MQIMHTVSHELQKLLMSCDTAIYRIYTERGGKSTRAVSRASVGRNALLAREVKREQPDCVELTRRQGELNNHSLLISGKAKHIERMCQRSLKNRNTHQVPLE